MNGKQSRIDRRLTEDQVREVRAIYIKRVGKKGRRMMGDTTPTFEELSERFGVTPGTLKSAASGRTYKWVTP